MRKWIIGLVVVALLIVAIVLLVPFGFGVWVENNALQLVKMAAANTSANVKLVSFKRRWFDSQAVMDISFANVTDANGQPLHLLVNENIQHGPIIKTKQGWKLAKAAIEISSTNAAVPFNLYGELSLNDNFSGNLSVDKILLKHAEQSILATGVRGDFTTNIKSHASRGQIEAMQISFDLPQPKTKAQAPTTEKTPLKLHWFNSSYTYDLTWHDPLWLGSSTMSSRRLLVLQGKDDVADCANIFLHSTLSQKDNLDAFHVNMKVKTMRFKQLFTDLNLDLAISGLNAKHYQRLVETLSSLNKASQADQKQVLNMSNDLLKDLVADGADININNFSVVTPDGPLKLRWLIKLPLQQTSEPSYLMVLAGLQTDLDLTMPRSWLQQVLLNIYKQRMQKIPSLDEQQKTDKQLALKVHKQIDSWIAAGQLQVVAGKQLHIHVNYKQGQLLINGNPLIMFGSGISEKVPPAQPRKSGSNQNPTPAQHDKSAVVVPHISKILQHPQVEQAKKLTNPAATGAH